jgi:hypothetical protein
MHGLSGSCLYQQLVCTHHAPDVVGVAAVLAEEWLESGMGVVN